MDAPASAIEAVAEYLPRLEGMLRAVFFVMGALLVVNSVRLAGRRAELGPSGGSWLKPLASLASGAALAAFPGFVSVLLATFFESGDVDAPESVFAYSGRLLSAVDGDFLRRPLASAIALIQFVGFVAVGRGVWFLNASSSPGGQRMFGPGCTFVIAGALAVNFPSFFGLLSELFARP